MIQDPIFVDEPAPSNVKPVSGAEPIFVDEEPPAEVKPQKSKTDIYNEEHPWSAPNQYGFTTRNAVTHNGLPSVQRSGDYAVWYGKEQGNTGAPGWFNQFGQRMPDVPTTDNKQTLKGWAQDTAHGLVTSPLKTVGKVASDVLQSVADIPMDINPFTPMSEYLEGRAPTLGSTGAGLVRGAAKVPLGIYQLTARLADLVHPGEYQRVAGNVKAITDFLNQGPKSAYGTELMGEMGAGMGIPVPGMKALGAIKGAPGVAARIGVGAGTGAAFGAAQTRPEAQTKEQYDEALAKDAAFGSLFGAGLSSLIEAAPKIVEGGSKAVGYLNEKLFKGHEDLSKILPDALIHDEQMFKSIEWEPGSRLKYVLEDITQYPTLVDDTSNMAKPLSQIEKQAMTGDKDAAGFLMRVRNAAAKEAGVELSLGDLTGIQSIKAKEQELASKFGGEELSKFKERQITQLGKNIESSKDTLESRALGGTYENAEKLRKDNSPSSRNIIKEATSTEAMAKATPESIVQNSLKINQKAAEIDSSDLYNAFHNRIATDAEAKGIADAVDMNPLMQTISNLKASNDSSLTRNKTLANELADLEGQIFGNPDLNTSIKSSLEQMRKFRDKATEFYESDAVGSKGVAKVYDGLARVLDDSIKKKVVEISGNEGEKLFKVANQHYMDKVLPFRDRDVAAIISGTDADAAVKKLLQATSVDKFGRIYSLLDGKGRDSVMTGIVREAYDAATKGEAFDIAAFRAALKKRAPLVNEAAAVQALELRSLYQDSTKINNQIDKIRKSIGKLTKQTYSGDVEAIKSLDAAKAELEKLRNDKFDTRAKILSLIEANAPRRGASSDVQALSTLAGALSSGNSVSALEKAAKMFSPGSLLMKAATGILGEAHGGPGGGILGVVSEMVIEAGLTRVKTKAHVRPKMPSKGVAIGEGVFPGLFETRMPEGPEGLKDLALKGAVGAKSRSPRLSGLAGRVGTKSESKGLEE